ncbi:MAG TPA: alpha-amylase family glycosyl hydrolase [Thermoanaerobaculia bacterium]|jgi:1,4-alpha-glucan branching enzyme
MTTRVRFTYYTGLDRPLWFNPRLTGSWNGWVPEAMTVTTAADGCPSFEATIDLPAGEHRWGVFVDSQARNNIWAVMDEAGLDTTERHRTFTIGDGETDRHETYFFTHLRRLGAYKDASGNIRFAVWAPHAKAVDVVFADASGYVHDDGRGIDAAQAPIALTPRAGGVWESDALAPFAMFAGRPYMFRITRDDGSTRFRTDLYSRHQIGRGHIDPAHTDKPYDGNVASLDGTKGASVVVDPDLIDGMPSADFWRDELSHDRPLPRHVEDLVIYELHIGSLGFGEHRPGTLADAAAPPFLTYLQDLGVNAIELLPMMEFAGDRQWGYATSHFHALESSAGGRDGLKRLVRACHQRGIAVLLDVVYNHYHHDAERAQWQYDSTRHEDNSYYWFEGRGDDYPAFNAAVTPDQRGMGGYLDNVSTGFAPRYHDENVRKLLIDSAVAMVEEFHIDGLRVDQTSSIRGYNKLHADGARVEAANEWGAKFLRQLSRTVKLVKPSAILIAEDHEQGEKEAALTTNADQNGLGFDAAWFSGFYHNLVGDAAGRSEARLIKLAGFGDDRPLPFHSFAGAMNWSGQKKVVYGESHDEAGNGEQTARTMIVAVGGAPLTGDTRRFAEARCRFAFAMAILSAGTPMLLAGDEIGATKLMKHDDPLGSKEDLLGQRAGDGAKLFACYSDLVKLRLRRSGLRSRTIRIVRTDNENRLIAFIRGDDEFLVIGTLSNQPRTHQLDVPGDWQELFNTDSALYGGDNIGNEGRILRAADGVMVPANGAIVLRRVT